MCVVLFFFQAEDGIRDLTVTGVQTCALPICDFRAELEGWLQNTLRPWFANRILDLDEQVILTWRRMVEAGRSRNYTLDRKSTRLNSSHSQISYAVFCLKKKKKHERVPQQNQV